MIERADDQRRVRRRKEDRFYGIAIRAAVLMAALAFLVSVVTGIVAIRNTNRIDSTQQHGEQRLEAAALGSCYRVNILRGTANHNSLTIYRVLLAAADATNSETAATAYRQYAEETRWTPKTDCMAAVDDPLKYHPPQPEAFPPPSQLHMLPDHDFDQTPDVAVPLPADP